MNTAEASTSLQAPTTTFLERASSEVAVENGDQHVVESREQERQASSSRDTEQPKSEERIDTSDDTQRNNGTGGQDQFVEGERQGASVDLVTRDTDLSSSLKRSADQMDYDYEHSRATTVATKQGTPASSAPRDVDMKDNDGVPARTDAVKSGEAKEAGQDQHSDGPAVKRAKVEEEDVKRNEESISTASYEPSAAAPTSARSEPAANPAQQSTSLPDPATPEAKVQPSPPTTELQHRFRSTGDPDSLTGADNLPSGALAVKEKEAEANGQSSNEFGAVHAGAGEGQETKVASSSTPAASTAAPAPAPATETTQIPAPAPFTGAPYEQPPTTPGMTIRPEVKAQTSTPMTKLQHRFLIRCIGGLKRTHDARFYKEPVDPVKMNIPSYFTIITHPMDMGTVEQKLKAGQYTTVDDVIADFDLMVNNAVTFNGAEHPVAKEGINLRAAFNRHLSKLPGVDEVEPLVPENKRSSKKGGAKSGPKREPRPSGGRASIASQGQTFALSPEGLPLIRRDSTAADGRPKRSIHPPKNRDLPYSMKPKKKKYVWELKFCQEALDEMFKPKHYNYAAAFYLPVDPVALNIPNYHSIIKRPMDLGTIQNKLKANLYENAKEFEADVRLMFKNCYKFNIVGDPTYTAGQKLNEVFDKKWANKDRWLQTHEPPSVRQDQESAADSDEEMGGVVSDEEMEESEADVDEEKLAALRRQMEELSKQVEVLSQKKKKTPPAPKKKGAAHAGSGSKAPRASMGGSAKKATAAANARGKKGGAGVGGSGKKEKAARWVSYQEKQLISNVISTLPEKQMNEALSIIQRNAPSLIGSSADGEIELDIDELPNEVLLKLLNFVKKHVPQAVAELEETTTTTYSHHSHAPVEPETLPSLAGNGRPRKNKPMNASEQEEQINALEDRLEMFKKGGGAGGSNRLSGGSGIGGGYGVMNAVSRSVEMDSSDDEDSEESEEE